MDKRRQWVCFFSQTGSEINSIRKQLGRDPDIVFINSSRTRENINKELLKDMWDYLYVLPDRPSDETYKHLEDSLSPDCIITLHGWLRILPGWFCDKYEIYNGHPGLIDKYPELKGFNPQEKAFNLGLKTTGSVIHRCTAEVDGGKLLSGREISIEGLTLDQVYEVLHNNSTELWVDFLRERLT